MFPPGVVRCTGKPSSLIGLGKEIPILWYTPKISLNRRLQRPKRCPCPSSAIGDAHVILKVWGGHFRVQNIESNIESPSIGSILRDIRAIKGV